MTLNSERVHPSLAVSGEGLTNTVSSRADHRPGQFKKYEGTCAVPITLPGFHWTPTVPRYWETTSRVQVNERDSSYLLEMAVMEGVYLDTRTSRGNSGWSVLVFDCITHVGFWCIRVWVKGRQVGGCLSTTPIPTPGTYTNIKLATVLDVGRGRLAFIDINEKKVLHKFDITFRQSVYPMFGVMPLFYSGYGITMRLYSGREISFTYGKRKLIAEALSSD